VITSYNTRYLWSWPSNSPSQDATASAAPKTSRFGKVHRKICAISWCEPPLTLVGGLVGCSRFYTGCSAYHRTRDSEGLRQWMQHVAEIRTRECEERCCAATLVGRARFRLVGRAHGPHQADVVTALRSYQASAPDANLKGAVGARPPNILLRHSGAVTAGYRPRHGGSGKGIPRAPAISAS
jgi:hypothetical protein